MLENQPQEGSGLDVWCWVRRELCFLLIKDGNILSDFIALRKDIKKDKLVCFDLRCSVGTLPTIRMCVVEPHRLKTLPRGLIGRECRELSFAYILSWCEGDESAS